MKVINTNGVKIGTADIPDILAKTTIIHFNQQNIEIPGVCIFEDLSNKKGTILPAILNPGLEKIDLSQEQLSEALELLNKEDSNSIYISTATIPAKIAKINLAKLKDEMVFFKLDGNTLLVNDIVFTTDRVEFNGSGMFTNRKAYLVEEETFEEIKERLLGISA